MTTPPPIQISDEAFAVLLAIVDRRAGKEHRGDGSVAAALREVIDALAPLIAAQVLRLAVDKIAAMAERLENSGDVFDREGAAWLRDAIRAIGQPAAQRRERSKPSKVSNVDKTDGGRSLAEDAP